MKKGFTLIELMIMITAIVIFCVLPILLFYNPSKSNKAIANEKDSPVYFLYRDGYTKLEFYVININGCQYATPWNGAAITHLANCTNCNKKVMLEKGEKQ